MPIDFLLLLSRKLLSPQVLILSSLEIFKTLDSMSLYHLRSATVSQERDGSYHISVLFEYEKEILPVTDPKRVIGLDYASGGLYVDDAGTRGTDHTPYRKPAFG